MAPGIEPELPSPTSRRRPSTSRCSPILRLSKISPADRGLAVSLIMHDWGGARPRWSTASSMAYAGQIVEDGTLDETSTIRSIRTPGACWCLTSRFDQPRTGTVDRDLRATAGSLLSIPDLKLLASQRCPHVFGRSALSLRHQPARRRTSGSMLAILGREEDSAVTALLEVTDPVSRLGWRLG